AIQQSKEELSEAELQWLRDWYSRNSTPLDQVIGDPAELDRLATQFEQQSHRRIAADRLLQALLRLRKRGQLPTVGRGKREMNTTSTTIADRPTNTSLGARPGWRRWFEH